MTIVHICATCGRVHVVARSVCENCGSRAIVTNDMQTEPPHDPPPASTGAPRGPSAAPPTEVDADDDTADTGPDADEWTDDEVDAAAGADAGTDTVNGVDVPRSLQVDAHGKVEPSAPAHVPQKRPVKKAAKKRKR